MNAKEALKNEIAAMNDAQLRATFDAIDAKITTPRECPAEFAVRLALCDELDLYGMIAKSILPELPGAKVETVGTLEGGATGMVQISCGPENDIIFA